MNKYIALFRVPVETMNEWKKNTKPEEMESQSKKIGDDMVAWMKKHDGVFVDRGIRGAVRPRSTDRVGQQSFSA